MKIDKMNHLEFPKVIHFLQIFLKIFLSFFTEKINSKNNFGS